MNMWLYEPERPHEQAAGKNERSEQTPAAGAHGSCPHCGAPVEAPPEPDRLGCCLNCLRHFGACPRCAAFVRVKDYWQRPVTPLPPLEAGPAGSRMSFLVEDDPQGGERAIFREAGHVVLLRQLTRALEWLECAGDGEGTGIHER